MKNNDEKYLACAYQTSLNSEEKTKVGCVLALSLSKNSKSTYTVLFKGHNVRETTGHIEHAEVMAVKAFDKVFRLEKTPQGSITAYITKAPCYNCCKLLIAYNVERLVCPPPYQVNTRTGEKSQWYDSQCKGLVELKNNNISVDFWEIPYDGF